MSQHPPIKLRITGPDGLSRDMLFTQESAIAGTGPSATLQLHDPRMSAVHFLLRVSKSGELSILDLGSEHGTQLKGAPVKEPTVIASGDVIVAGATHIKVSIGEGDVEGTEIVQIPADGSEVTGEGDVPDVSDDAMILSGEDTDSGGGATVQDRVSTLKSGKSGVTTAARPVAAAGRSSDSAAKVRSSDSGAKARSSEDNVQPLRIAKRGTKDNDRSLSGFQGSALAGDAFALGPNGNRLLNEEMSEEERPTESNRRLEVALLWGDTVIDVRAFDPGQTVKIGPSAGADFRVYDDSITAAFTLVSNGTVSVPAGGSVTVYRDGKAAKAGDSTQLGLDQRALLSFGTTHFIVRWIRPSARAKTGFFDSVDFYFTKVLSVAFMAHLVLLIGFWITPLNNDLLSEDLFKNPSDLVKTLIKPPEKKKKFDLSGVKEGAKAKDKEGKFGKKEAKKAEAAPSKKGAPIVDAKKREEDRKKIMNSGLLMGLKGPEGAVSNVFGPGGLGTGLNNALGGLQGSAGMGDAHGVGGLGSRGAGPGGGGTALGIGGLGTKGNGHGRGGYGNLDLGGRGKGTTRIVPGKTIVEGSLPRDVIERIIRQHQNEIKYCYDVELNKHPDLYGKISMSFTIDGTGGVSEANVGETTMNNSNVENCMSTKIRRWKFPEPKGGGQVFVTYPWIFKAPGSED